MTSVRGQLTIARRPTTAADIPLLRELFADAHLELAVLPTDTRFVLIDMRFRAERRQHAATYPSAAHDVLVIEGAEVGRVLVDRGGGVIRIVDITVALDHRREGIAGAVLAEIAREADKSGRRAELVVWSGNAAAVALVRRAGFFAGTDEGGYVTYARIPRAAAG